LWWLRSRKQFHGQLFLLYLIAYATGRGVIELFRGDLARGFVIDGVLSNSQFISLLVIGTAFYFYAKWKRRGKLPSPTTARK
jgi:phosphatidylglycerol:prolipoprotein diacylglycerol transferase